MLETLKCEVCGQRWELDPFKQAREYYEATSGTAVLCKACKRSQHQTDQLLANQSAVPNAEAEAVRVRAEAEAQTVKARARAATREAEARAQATVIEAAARAQAALQESEARSKAEYVRAVGGLGERGVALADKHEKRAADRVNIQRMFDLLGDARAVIENEGRPAGSIDACAFEYTERQTKDGDRGITFADRFVNLSSALSSLTDLRQETSRIGAWDAAQSRESVLADIDQLLARGRKERVVVAGKFMTAWRAAHTQRNTIAMRFVGAFGVALAISFIPGLPEVARGFMWMVAVLPALGVGMFLLRPEDTVTALLKPNCLDDIVDVASDG